MKNIRVVILGMGTPEPWFIPVDDTFFVSKDGVVYQAASIYQIEVDWVGDETTLYTVGKVVEFATAEVGIDLLRAINSGKQRFTAPNSSRGEIDDDE